MIGGGEQGILFSAASPKPLPVVAPKVPVNLSQLVLLQIFVTIGLSYQLLFSRDTLLTGEIREFIILGLLLIVVSLMLLPGRLAKAGWLPGALALGDTAITATIIYLSGNASSDLYLTFFLIIMIAALAPTLKQMLVLSIILCVGYGVVLYLGTQQSGVLLEGHLLRIPTLLILAAFYGATAETVRKVRQQKASLLENITAREQAEKALRESEARFRDLVENTSDILWEMDPNGAYTYCSPRVAAILGYEPDELLGKTLIDFMPPGEAKRIGDLFCRIAAERRPFALLAHQVCHKSGSIRILERSGKPVFDDRGQFKGFRGVDRDITRRERAEEALERLSRQRELILNSVGEGIYGLDLQGNVTFGNPAAARTTGWRTEELLGKPLHDSLHRTGPDGTHFSKEECRTCAAFQEGSISRVADEVFRKKDGTSFPVEYVTTPIHDKRGEVVGTVVTFQDITERKKLEQQLRQSQKMEAIGKLAGGVAHDFNNLLTAIMGYSDLTLTGMESGAPLRKDVEEIKKTACRAAALTRQLLVFSRQQVLQPKVLDLNAVVANMNTMLPRLIGEDIELITLLDPGLGRVKADAGQIEQVILNLAVNARDAMPQGGTLTIETANVVLDEGYVNRHPTVKAGPYVMLAVSDTGCGMDPETQSRIFEPFFTTKEEGKGTGLGLSTVYGIVEQYCGSIWVYSELGMGTTFKVYLPRNEEASATVESDSACAPSPHGLETVLLVEDEEAVRQVSYEVLRRNGYTVLVAHNGEEALQVCERYKGSISLLVTDVVMPGMSGRELAESLARSRPDMKVLYTSGYTDDAVVRHGVLKAGMAFLQKPFMTEALARKVRDLLDAPARV
jgi:PAS domain S-box-containing protein